MKVMFVMGTRPEVIKLAPSCWKPGGVDWKRSAS